MMHSRYVGWYYEAEDFTAISYPVRNGGSLWVFLPKTELAELLSSSSWLTCLENAETASPVWADISLSLPKFTVNGNIDFLQYLEEMGITRVADPALAEFSLLSELNSAVALSSASQAAMLTVDENGLSAAAFTALMMTEEALISDISVSFQADKPFLFAVTGQDGSLLLAGSVTQPS